MKELNEMIANFEKPKVIPERIPDGFKKDCDCVWKFGQPDYTRGMFVVKSEIDVFEKKQKVSKNFVECDRWFCPICNVELKRNSKEGEN